jgi:DNA transformation protein
MHLWLFPFHIQPITMSREFADYILDMLRPLGDVRCSRFFDGHQIRVDGEQIVIGGQLYFRVGEKLRAEIEDAGGRPFAYTTRKGRVTVPRYFNVPDQSSS